MKRHGTHPGEDKTPRDGGAAGAGAPGTAADTAGQAGGPAAEPAVEPAVEPAAGQAGDADVREPVEADPAVLLADLSDQYLRLAAEYDNFRRRTQKEKEALYADARADVSREWLPVLDSMESAISALSGLEGDVARRSADGVSLVLRQARDVLDRLGIREIDACGEPFDPELHEAVVHEPGDGGVPKVLGVLRKGYRTQDRVLRHSLVRVGD